MLRRVAMLAGLCVLCIPSPAFAIDCNGDGVDNPAAGLDSATAAATCGAEMVGVVWNTAWPFVIAAITPCFMALLARWAIRAVRL